MEENKTADVSPKDLITPDKIDWNAAGSEEFKEGGHFVYAEMLPHIEYYKNQLTQQQSANAELKQQLSDKDTAFILSKNAAKRRGEKIKELKKQNAELVELIKIAQNNIPVGGSKQSQERYLNFMERSTEILKQIENTPPKN